VVIEEERKEIEGRKQTDRVIDGEKKRDIEERDGKRGRDKVTEDEKGGE
jgi:hypothetical protein